MLERFGLDSRRATAVDVFEGLYYLLRERVLTGLGMFRGPLPLPPDECDYAGRDEAYRAACDEWRVGLCGVARWTTVDELDRHLLGVG